MVAGVIGVNTEEYRKGPSLSETKEQPLFTYKEPFI